MESIILWHNCSGDNSHIPVRAAIFSGTSKADNMYSVREFGNKSASGTEQNIHLNETQLQI